MKKYIKPKDRKIYYLAVYKSNRCGIYKTGISTFDEAVKKYEDYICKPKVKAVSLLKIRKRRTSKILRLWSKLKGDVIKKR